MAVRNHGTLWEEDHCVAVIEGWRPTGIVSLARSWTGPLTLARSRGIPIVQGQEMDSDPATGRPPPAVPRLHLDVRAVAGVAADYLAGRGLRSVAFAGGLRPTAARLEAAFRAAAATRGLAYAAFIGEPRAEVAGGAAAGGAARFRDWATGLPRPTGVLASEDWFAWHAIGECRSAGLRVPDDLAVMGVGDDEPWCGLAPVPLTSVALAPEAVGYRAAALLDRLMRGDRVPPAAVLVPPAGVVTRRSTDVVAADDPDVADALRFIHDHAGRGCGVGDVLRAVAIDRRRLERWCRHHLGRSPLAEIQRVRVAHVKRLLADTDDPLPAVARAAGYATVPTLCRAFRRETGGTVARYRRQFRDGGRHPG